MKTKPRKADNIRNNGSSVNFTYSNAECPVETQGCFCGDSKEIKRQLKNFSKTSTMHGAVYLNPNSQIRFIWLWRLLLLCMCIGVTVQLIFMIHNAVSRHPVYITTITKEGKSGGDVKGDFPDYPGVTICKLPPFKPYETGDRDMLKWAQFLSLSLSIPFVGLSPKEKSFLFDIKQDPEESDIFKQDMNKAHQRFQNYVSQNPNYDLKEMIFNISFKCEEMFRSCYVEAYIIDCCDVFLPILTSSGVCFTLRVNDRLKLALSTLKGMNFIIDLFSTPRHAGSYSEKGFAVYLMDPSIPIKFIGTPGTVKVAPDTTVYIAAKLQFTDRTAYYSNWFGFSTNCPSLPEVMEKNSSLRTNYVIQSCNLQFLASFTKESCQCETLITWSKDSEYPICDPYTMMTCLPQAFRNNTRSMFDVCISPCYEYTYFLSITYAGFDGENQNQSMSQINIRYDHDEYIFNEYNRFTISTFFSQIGGAMGLTLGASLITAVEFLFLLIRLAWHAVMPIRRRHKMFPTTKKVSAY